MPEMEAWRKSPKEAAAAIPNASCTAMEATTVAGTRNGNEATERAEAAFWEPRWPSCDGGKCHSKQMGTQHKNFDAQLVVGRHISAAHSHVEPG